MNYKLQKNYKETRKENRMAKVIDEKVKQIKEAIKKFGEETVDTIVTRKKENRIFYSQSKFNEWLQENYKGFTKKELEILKFKTTEEMQKNTKEDTEKIQENTKETTKKIQKNTKIKKAEEQEDTEKIQETTEEQQQENTEKIEAEIVENTKEIQKNTKEDTEKIQETTNQTTLVISEKLKNEELGKKFLYFLDNIDEFIRIGEKAQNDLMIPREIMEMKSSPTSVRISKEVLEKFNRFCDEHKNYSKMQLMNFALSEFVDRYTKE